MKKHRVFTILLTIALVAAFMPVMAFAGEEHVHQFGEPEYSWELNLHKLVRYYDCTAERTCLICGEKETETASVKVRTDERDEVGPTCTRDGGYLYTVSFQNKAFADQEYIKTPLVGKKWKALGHDWQYMWDWYEEDTQAKATRYCSRCGEYSTVDADVTVVFKDATWFDPYTITSTAKAVFDGNTVEDTVQSTQGFGLYEESENAFDYFYTVAGEVYDLEFLYQAAKESFDKDPSAIHVANVFIRAEDFALRYYDCREAAENVIEACSRAGNAYEELTAEQKDEEAYKFENLRTAVESAEEYLNNQALKDEVETALKNADAAIMREIANDYALAALKEAIDANITSAKGYTDSSVKAVNDAIAAVTAVIDSEDFTAIESACDDLRTAVQAATLKSDSKLKVKAKKPLNARKGKTTKYKISKAVKISGKAGTLTYKKANKAGGSRITVSEKTGKITVRKGLKKGKTYSLKIRVKDSGNGDVLAGSALVTVKIRVK